MGGFLEFIRRLFGGGKKKKPPSSAELINDIIASTAGLNLTFITGEERTATAVRARFAVFEKALQKDGAGYVLEAFESDERPRVSMVFPASLIDPYLSIMKKTHSDRAADGDRAADLLVNWLDGRISRLFFLDRGDTVSFYRMKKPYAQDDAEALLWAASSCAIIDVSDGRRSWYVLVDERTDERLKKDIAGAEFRRAARALIVTEHDPDLYAEDEEMDEDIVLTLTKPREFLLGRFFLPVKASAGGHSFFSRFDRIIIPAQGSACAAFESHWMKLIVRADGGTGVAYYLFRDRGGDPMARVLVTADVFRAILKDTMLFLKSHCPSLAISAIQFQAGARPADGEAESCAVLSAAVTCDHAPVQAQVFVTEPFLDLLYRHLLSPWEISLLQRTMRNRLIAIVSLNRTVFSRGLRRFVKDTGAASLPVPVEITSLPFYEFVELVGDGDLKIIIQNFLAPKYGPSYRQLFAISTTESAGEGGIQRSRIVEVEYDRQRFERYLPALVKDGDEPWRHASAPDRFDGVNREAMEGLFRAMEEDRIVLSYRARYILANQFHEVLQNEYAARIETYRRAGTPFTELGELGNRERALVVGRLPNGTLALAVAAVGKGGDTFEDVMNDTRRADFADDLAIARERFAKGETRPGDAVAAIDTVIRAVEEEKRRSQKDKDGKARKGR